MTTLRGQSLALSNVGHVFGSTVALDNVNLSVASGELIALLGPSGCGKTTMLQIIAGFLKPTSGEVLFAGERVEHIPANRRRIGMVFQNYALFPHLTVFENVAYGLRARNTRGDAVSAKVAEMLALVQMSRFAKRLPGELSGGQQQRVALARALAIDPGVVLLDEPFSALDKNLRLDMQIEVKSLLKSYGVTSIIVTHDQEEALSMADRIVVLNKGNIEQIDTPDALYDRPSTLFVNSFIGHTNFLRGTVTATDRVKLNAGPELTLARPTQRINGTDIILSVRPENFTLVEQDTSGAIPATVRVTMPLGAFGVMECTTGSGEPIKISQPRSSSTLKAIPGSRVGLTISDIGAVGFFNAPFESTTDAAKES